MENAKLIKERQTTYAEREKLIKVNNLWKQFADNVENILHNSLMSDRDKMKAINIDLTLTEREVEIEEGFYYDTLADIWWEEMKAAEKECE